MLARETPMGLQKLHQPEPNLLLLMASDTMEQRLANRQEEGEGVGIHPLRATCLHNLKVPSAPIIFLKFPP